MVDEIVCVATPEPFLAVGMWYEDFSETSDEEVRELLAQAGGDLSGIALGGSGEREVRGDTAGGGEDDRTEEDERLGPVR